MNVGYLPDFGNRRAVTYLTLSSDEKKTCQNIICSLSPGDDSYGRLVFQSVVLIVQKLFAENGPNKLARTDYTYTEICQQLSHIPGIPVFIDIFTYVSGCIMLFNIIHRLQATSKP